MLPVVMQVVVSACAGLAMSIDAPSAMIEATILMVFIVLRCFLTGDLPSEVEEDRETEEETVWVLVGLV